MVTVDKIYRLLAVFVSHSWVAACLAHHFYHLQTEVRVFFIGKANCHVERSVLVLSGEWVAFEILDIEKGVHDIV